MEKIDLPAKSCLTCGVKFDRYTCRQLSDFRVKKFCSRKCYFKHNTGPNHWFWKGGFKIRQDGYVRDSKTDKFIHRIVMEKSIGRKLKTFEVVHHKNHNPSDNRIVNLVLMTNSKHRKLHCINQKRSKKGRFAK